MRPQGVELLCVLRDALGVEPLSAGFAVGDGAALFAVAERQQLAQLLAGPLSSCGALAALPNELSERMERARLLAVYSVTRLAHAQAEITDLFEREGIDYTPLKGAILRELWPAPWMRTSCDLDLLIRPEDTARATEALTQQLGYSLRTVGFRDASLYSQDGSIHVELHFTLKNPTDRGTALAAPWDYAERIGDSHAHRLRSDYLIYYLLCHLLAHMESGGGGIRPVIDLALLCRRPYDRAGLDALLRDGGLALFADAVLALGEGILGDGVPTGTPAALLD